MRSYIADLSRELKDGASVEEIARRALVQLDAREGSDTPVLCRTAAGLKQAEEIEWRELRRAVAAENVSAEQLDSLDRARAEAVRLSRESASARTADRVPPTTALVAAILHAEESRCAGQEHGAGLEAAEESHPLASALRETAEALPASLLQATSKAAAKRPVHAFLHRTQPEELLNRARDIDRRLGKGDDLPLAGVLLAVKDNLALSRTTAASMILDEYDAPEDYAATAVDRLLRAGALPLGKANMDEFSLGSSNESTAYWPAPRNPHDARRVPGGSSGGCAAAVGAGFVLGGIGSDTSGSLRCPASYCGSVGVKPTYGLISRFGLFAHGSSWDCVGPIAPTVTDAALLLGYMAWPGPDGLDRTMRRSPELAHAADAAEMFAGTLRDGTWRERLRGRKVGLPIELFLRLDPDDSSLARELTEGPFDIAALRRLGAETGLFGDALGRFVEWLSGRPDVPRSLDEERATAFWEEFCRETGGVECSRDRMHASPGFWDELEGFVQYLSDELGAEPKLVSLPHASLAIPAYFVLSRQELASNLHRFDGLKYGMPAAHDDGHFYDVAERHRMRALGAQPKQRIMMGINVLQSKNHERLLRRAQRARRAITTDLDRACAEVDLLLSPTVPSTAPIWGGFNATVAQQRKDEMLVPANHAGIPAASVPLYREADGLFQSLQIMAPPFAEKAMFELAAAVERYREEKEDGR